MDNIQVFKADEEIKGISFKCFRIPSIIKVGDKLLAFAEARLVRKDTGFVRTVMKFSNDNGKTWSDGKIVAKIKGDVLGNPCPVFDKNTNTIHLLLTWNQGDLKEYDILQGKGIRVPYQCTSQDFGESWSDPIPIENARKSEWFWYATGPGIGIQLKNGRLVIPCNHSHQKMKRSYIENIYRAHTIYSDDGGKTWDIGCLQPPGTNESQIAQLEDGRVVHNMRNQDKTCRSIAIGRDGVTWDSVEEGSIEAAICQGSIISWGRGLLFSCPKDLDRANLQVWVLDENLKIQKTIKICPTSAAYSCLINLGQGKAGILYERDDFKKIVFKKFNV